MKNEAWILDKFLSCTSLWADHIILLDQQSEDDSVKIAKQHQKVNILQNDQKEFNDFNHWNVLLNEARKIQAERRIIISIDCDEIFSANSFDSSEWKFFTEKAKPGSLMVCNRIMLSPDFETYRKEPDFLIGFVDDNSSSISDLSVKKHIHNIRLPYPSNDPDVYYVNSIKLMHFNVVDYNRMRSKMNWYQCYEMILKDKNLFTILEQYYTHPNFENFWKQTKVFNTKSEWFELYENRGIAIKTTIKNSINYYWDFKILSYFKEHGTKLFAKLPIWDKNWIELSKKHDQNFKIERSIGDKIFLKIYVIYKNKENSKIKSLLKFILTKFF
jgi:hypothetical protein